MKEPKFSIRAINPRMSQVLQFGGHQLFLDASGFANRFELIACYKGAEYRLKFKRAATGFLCLCPRCNKKSIDLYPTLGFGCVLCCGFEHENDMWHANFAMAKKEAFKLNLTVEQIRQANLGKSHALAKQLGQEASWAHWQSTDFHGAADITRSNALHVLESVVEKCGRLMQGDESNAALAIASAKASQVLEHIASDLEERKQERVTYAYSSPSNQVRVSDMQQESPHPITFDGARLQCTSDLSNAPSNIPTGASRE